MAATSGSIFITMPGPPPKGRSSVTWWRSVGVIPQVDDPKLHGPQVLGPLQHALAESGDPKNSGNRVSRSIRISFQQSLGRRHPYKPLLQVDFDDHLLHRGQQDLPARPRPPRRRRGPGWAGFPANGPAGRRPRHHRPAGPTAGTSSIPPAATAGKRRRSPRTSCPANSSARLRVSTPARQSSTWFLRRSAWMIVYLWPPITTSPGRERPPGRWWRPRHRDEPSRPRGGHGRRKSVPSR